MLLVLLESPAWVGFKEGDLEAFRPKMMQEILGFEWFLLLKIQSNYIKIIYIKIVFEGKISWITSKNGTGYTSAYIKTKDLGIFCVLGSHFSCGFYVQ
jgi:hypothetical protein